MSSAEDFQVIFEEPGEGMMNMRNTLKELVYLFHSSIDALNQSTTLLRDELQNVLSVALQNTDPEENIDTKELLQSFSASLSSTDEIRKNYVRRLCTKLVSLESEKTKLESECVRLKCGSYIEGDKLALEEQMNAIMKTMGEISTILAQLEDKSAAENLVTGPSDVMEMATLESVHRYLVDIRDRLSNLNLSTGQQIDTNSKDEKKPDAVTSEELVSTCEEEKKNSSNSEIKAEEQNSAVEKCPVDPTHELFQIKLAKALTASDFDLSAKDNLDENPKSSVTERKSPENKKTERKVKFKEGGLSENRYPRCYSPRSPERLGRGFSPPNPGDPQQWYGLFRGAGCNRFYRSGAPHYAGIGRFPRSPYLPGGYPHVPFTSTLGYGLSQPNFTVPRHPTPDFGSYGMGSTGRGKGMRPNRTGSKTRNEERTSNWIPDFIWE